MHPQLLGFITSCLSTPEEREYSTQSIYISLPWQVPMGCPWMLHPPIPQSLCLVEGVAMIVQGGSHDHLCDLEVPESVAGRGRMEEKYAKPSHHWVPSVHHGTTLPPYLYLIFHFWLWCYCFFPLFFGCCLWAFSSCREQRLLSRWSVWAALFIAVASFCRAWALGRVAFSGHGMWAR